MNKKRKLTTESTYHDMLGRIEQQFDHAEDTKSKTFFMRLDLHYPQEMDVPQDNRHHPSSL